MASLKMNLLVLIVAVIGVYLVHEISGDSRCGYFRRTTWDYRVSFSTYYKYYYRVYYGVCDSSGNFKYALKVSVNGKPLYYTIRVPKKKRSIETEDAVFEKVERRNEEAEERQTKSAEKSEYYKILRGIEGQKASKRSAGYLTTDIEN